MPTYSTVLWPVNGPEPTPEARVLDRASSVSGPVPSVLVRTPEPDKVSGTGSRRDQGSVAAGAPALPVLIWSPAGPISSVAGPVLSIAGSLEVVRAVSRSGVWS
jgi:hypothetical protein